MLFNVPGHIEMIQNGTKTQTRRINRGIYQVGRDYAVQCKRGVKAESDIRIMMDTIWIELYAQVICYGISKENALAEGGYSPIEFEQNYRKLYPKSAEDRWAFEFHGIKVQK